MKLYNTVRQKASAEQTIERSRFIAHVCPVKTREEAERFIAQIRRQYRDATHNVPAMVLGDKMQVQWASDDGEPQGTSGAPMVQMLVKEELTNLVIVVTRYFGGIKLGTGGLVRAYTSSAKLGLEAAGICAVEEQVKLTYAVEYPLLSKLQNIAAAPDGGFSIADIRYTEVVELDLTCQTEAEDQVRALLTNLTAGKGVCKDRQMALVQVPK